MLIDPEPGRAQQAMALLHALPELDSPALDQHLAAALLEQASQLDWWLPTRRLLRAWARVLMTRAALRLGVLRRLCLQHALDWQKAELSLALHQDGPGRRSRSLYALVQREGVLQWEGSWRLPPDHLILAIPPDHPLWQERAWIRQMGRRLQGGLELYLPLAEERDQPS